MSMGLDEIQQLTSAIDSLLALDAGELADDDLHQLVTTLQRQRHRLVAAAATAISAWDQRMVWADNGAGSAAVRLANDTSSSPASAGIEIKRARKLRTMPHVSRALAEGALSPDHVDLLAKANRPWRNADFSEHEALLVEQCSTLRFRDARKMVDYWCQRADAVAAEEQAERQRNAALVEMATRSATAPADGRRPKPLFTVLVGDDTMSNLCELANGTVITPGQVFRYAGDADLETVLFDGPSTVISVSHRRTFTGRLRRAVEVRDRHCRHTSGCDVPADQCDVDHIVPHAADGPTSQFNGKLECQPHNRNPERHDHGGIPRPARPIDRLDEIRCRLRWRLLRDDPDDPDDPETFDGADDASGVRSDRGSVTER